MVLLWLSPQGRASFFKRENVSHKTGFDKFVLGSLSVSSFCLSQPLSLSISLSLSLYLSLSLSISLSLSLSLVACATSRCYLFLIQTLITATEQCNNSGVLFGSKALFILPSFFPSSLLSLSLSLSLSVCVSLSLSISSPLFPSLLLAGKANWTFSVILKMKHFNFAWLARAYRATKALPYPNHLQSLEPLWSQLLVLVRNLVLLFLLLAALRTQLRLRLLFACCLGHWRPIRLHLCCALLLQYRCLLLPECYVLSKSLCSWLLLHFLLFEGALVMYCGANFESTSNGRSKER